MVLAAGEGSRMGGNTAKQYMEIGGKPLAGLRRWRCLKPLPVIDEIILMTDAGHMEYVQTGIVRRMAWKKVSTHRAPEAASGTRAYGRRLVPLWIGKRERRNPGCQGKTGWIRVYP
ncbi:MAG: 2-C-methyl-D-erythritol 4-phosphate cytidylyltransferase [Enterocloster bolteae]